MDADAVIIEVGLNEVASPLTNPHVPQTPAECGADACRCADAGAAIVHWHAVNAEGAQQLGDAALYGAALDAMHGRVLAYPSYPTSLPDTVENRLGHCFILRRHHGLELGPIDVASVNRVMWNRAEATLAPLEPLGGEEVIRNSLPFVVDALRCYRDAGLIPTLASFDVGSSRTIGALMEAGLATQPALVKIFLWGSPMIGPAPSVEALDLHLRQIPDHLDVEWIVVPYGVDDPALIEELGRAAIERGGGVRVGIGDTPRAVGAVANASLVELVASWAADAGRPVASADDLRVRLATSS
jgi:3-keto-5-aminohexanoate cleavage enzyme